MKPKKLIEFEGEKSKSMSLGYLVQKGEKSQGNVVMYHYYDISESK
jgi:hypothetical protein